jgi:hypothetical protein
MHNCPNCGQACYCSGDIDDVDAGDKEAEENCMHACDYEDAEDDVFDEVLDASELADELPPEVPA